MQKVFVSDTIGCFVYTNYWGWLRAIRVVTIDSHVHSQSIQSITQLNTKVTKIDSQDIEWNVVANFISKFETFSDFEEANWFLSEANITQWDSFCLVNLCRCSIRHVNHRHDCLQTIDRLVWCNDVRIERSLAHTQGDSSTDDLRNNPTDILLRHSEDILHGINFRIDSHLFKQFIFGNTPFTGNQLSQGNFYRLLFLWTGTYSFQASYHFRQLIHKILSLHFCNINLSHNFFLV